MHERERHIIEANVRGYRRHARGYERVHGEIFNPVEQARLRGALERALASVAAPASPPSALDFGAGTGNLTRHLLDLGARVTAADLSPDLLRMVERRFAPTGRVETCRLNGRDLAQLANGTFDLVATYSVLHHIPDYLGAVGELARVVRPGGVLVIDHEASPNEYADDPLLAEFRAEALAAECTQPKRLSRFVDRHYYASFARHYYTQFRRLRDPRFWPEGDIHIWPDDHIEWPKLEAVIADAGLEVVESTDYLLYRRGTPLPLYEGYRERTADTRLLIARRTP